MLMDSVQATAPTLLPIAADLANLTVGISMHHITVRLMRMWEARNFKKSDELMSLEQLRFKQCASPSHGLVAVGEKFLAASQLRNTSASSGSIFFWSWTKPQVEVKSFPVESINSIVANSEGTYLVGGGISGDIYISLGGCYREVA